MQFIKYYLVIIFIFSISLNANNLKDISLQFQWKHQFQFAGYYIAKEKGFYKESGFNVDLKEFEFGMNVPNEISNKKSTYGVGRPTLMISKSNRNDLVLLASIFQSSPNVWIALKDRGISSLNDFKNKKVMVTGDAKEDAAVMSMFFSRVIYLNNLNVVEHSFDVNDLISGKTDLMSAYISNEPFLLKQKGFESIIFDPKDYGFDFYNDILFTTQDEINNNLEDVKKFKDASIKGWEYAFNNIEETVDIILKKYNTQNKSKEALIYEANELKKLAYYKTDKLGQIEKNKIERMIDYYKLIGFIKNEIDLDNFIFDYERYHFLSKEEIDYLKEKEKITMCIHPSFMPFQSFDENGNHLGMTSDYFKLFEEKLNTKFEIIKTNSWPESLTYAKEKKCDILGFLRENPERRKFLNFTEPYLSAPLVVATTLEKSFINSIGDLYGKKVAVMQGHSVVEYLKKYPNIDIVEVTRVKEGLEKVEDGDVFAFIGLIPSIAYESNINNFTNIKIAGKLYEDWEFRIGVRNDDLILLNILNKSIKFLTDEKKEEISNKWLSIKYTERINYELLWKSVVPLVLLLSILIYFFNKQNKLKNKLEESNEKLSLAYEEVEKLSVTDKLTNLYNRYKIDSVLNDEKKKADRYNLNFGILILDIDFFKKVNDNYGHLVGDEVLIEFSSILKNNSRETDIVGRWGGEEFLIIVPHTEYDSLLYFANNLRKKIENYEFRTVGKVTASIGVSIYEKDDEIINAINRADEAVYVSKSSGRNCVSYK